jgi:serine/threonine protein kinase
MCIPLSHTQDGSSGEHIVKIGDLGVAKLMSTSTAFANTVVGTPYNLSPELCQDQVSSSNTIAITQSSCDAATCYHKYMQDMLQCAALLAFKVISANKKSGVIVLWYAHTIHYTLAAMWCIVSRSNLR